MRFRTVADNNGNYLANGDGKPLPQGMPRSIRIAPANSSRRLRVAFVTGLVGERGAEKQLVYMASALKAAGVEVRIFTLKKEMGFYGPKLAGQGIEPVWVGRSRNPLLRLASLTVKLRQFAPDFVQATHFYTNLYATVSGRLAGGIAIGCSRNDVFSEIKDCGGWGRWLLRVPTFLLVNSHAAKSNSESLGLDPTKIHVISNVIDLPDFDARQSKPAPALARPGQPVAIAVGRLFTQKRFDRFLLALARARATVPDIKGIIAGDGPEWAALEQQAKALDLFPDNLAFVGRRSDVPALLRQAHMLVLSSDHEGFPNVVLEAMAARLPVIATPAGESDLLVHHGETGYLVPFDDTDQMGDRMAQLAQSPALRQNMGEAGRQKVEQHYSYENLAKRLLSIYRDLGVYQGRNDLVHLLSEVK
jgi:glycosyltransferase involved in cell wall biosynthesis